MKDIKELARKIDKFTKDFEHRLNYDQHKYLHELWNDVVLTDNPKAFEHSFNFESFDRTYKHITYSKT